MASGVSERSVYEGITAYSPRHFLNWLSWSQVFPSKIATFVRHAVNVSYSFWSQVGLYGSSPVWLLIHTLSIGRVAGNIPIGLVTHGSQVHQPCKQDFRSSQNLGASVKAMSTRLFSLSLGSRVNAFLVIMRVLTGRWCLHAEIEYHFQYSFSLCLRDNQLCSWLCLPGTEVTGLHVTPGILCSLWEWSLSSQAVRVRALLTNYSFSS